MTNYADFVTLVWDYEHIHAYQEIANRHEPVKIEKIHIVKYASFYTSDKKTNCANLTLSKIKVKKSKNN